MCLPVDRAGRVHEAHLRQGFASHEARGDRMDVRSHDRSGLLHRRSRRPRTWAADVPVGLLHGLRANLPEDMRAGAGELWGRLRAAARRVPRHRVLSLQRSRSPLRDQCWGRGPGASACRCAGEGLSSYVLHRLRAGLSADVPAGAGKLWRHLRAAARGVPLHRVLSLHRPARPLRQQSGRHGLVASATVSRQGGSGRSSLSAIGRGDRRTTAIA